MSFLLLAESETVAAGDVPRPWQFVQVTLPPMQDVHFLVPRPKQPEQVFIPPFA